MSLNNFAMCNPDHSANINYICYGRTKSFCKECFRKHQQTCVSSRCGDVRRLSYSLLERYEFFRLKANLLNVNPSSTEYGELKDIFGNNYNNFTKIIKEHVERKLPFMVLQLQSALLDNFLSSFQTSVTSSSSTTSNFSYDQSKYDRLYPSIKELLHKEKPDQRDLDFIVEKMNDINFLDNTLKQNCKKRWGTERSDTSLPGRGREALELARNIRRELEYNLDVRDSLDTIIAQKFRDIVLMLGKSHTPTTYEIMENMKEPDEMKFLLGTLEQNPDEMIEAAKHLMKKSLYQQHTRVAAPGTFPYRYCYIISTCAVADPSYEKLVISLEKKLVDSIQLVDQPTNITKTLDELAKRIVIVGPEVIQIEFSRHKQRRNLHMTIYGYVETRQTYYAEVLKLLGINAKNFIDLTSDANKIRIVGLATPMDVAYHNIELASSIIFKDHLMESETGRRDQGKKLMQQLLRDEKQRLPEFEQRKLDEFEACEYSSPIKLFMRSISSYRINRLLLSGDYICCDAENSLYLLAQVKQPPQLHNIHLQGIVLPIEIIYMNEGEALYCCFPLEPSMTQCLGRARGRSHMPLSANVQQLMLSLALTVMNAANDRTLRSELLSCLHVSNLWLAQNGVEVMWHQRTQHEEKYSEDKVVRRLGEIFFFLNYGKEFTSKQVNSSASPTFKNELIERMVDGGVSLQETYQLLVDRQATANRLRRPSKGGQQKKPSTTKRFSIVDGRNYRIISGQGKRSAQRTELSLEKSIMLMRQAATITPTPNPNPASKESRRRLVSNKKNGSVVPLANILKYSESIRGHGSIDVNSFQHVKHPAVTALKQINIDSWAHNRYSHYIPQPDKSQQHTEAVSISSLVLARALEAYEKEKKNTISFDKTVDLVKHEQTIRQHVSLEKERNQEIIATSRKARIMEMQSNVKMEMSQKDKRAYNLINRGNRLMQARLQQPLHMPIEHQTQPLPQSVVTKPPSAKVPSKEIPPPTSHQKFEQFTQQSLKSQPEEKIKEKHPSHEPEHMYVEMPKVNLNNTTNVIPPPVKHQQQIPQQTQSNTSISKGRKDEPPVMIVEQSREKLRQANSKTAEKNKPKAEKIMRQDQFDGIEEIVPYDREQPSKQKPQQPAPPKSEEQKPKKQPKQTKDVPPPTPPPSSAKPKKRKQQFSDDEIEQITLQGKKPTPQVKAPPPPPPPAPPAPATTPKNQRIKSEASQNSDKIATSIATSVDEYVAFINLMGEAVGKSQKATKSLQDVDWFTGVYYVYKRFIRQRKKIQGWLEEGLNKFTRNGKPLDQAAFDKWLKSTHRTALLDKIHKDNGQIQKAIGKMHQSILKKNVSPRVTKHSSLDRISEEDSFIAVQYVLNEINEIIELEEVSDELLLHMVEILDALFIIAELDGRSCCSINVMERRQLKSFLPYFQRQEKYIDQLRRNYGLTS